MNSLSVVAIIPARGGSKGLHKKNIVPLLGKPLIYYTIKAAQDSRLVDRIIVSTDCEEIKNVSIGLGAEVPFLRPKKYAHDMASSESVLKHAVQWLEENENYKTDIVVYLQPTDIFRKKGMIDTLVQVLLDDKNIDSAFVAFRTHKKFWMQKDGKYIRLTSKKYIPRQAGFSFFREDAGLACATRAEIIKQENRIGDNIFILQNDDECSMIDIHDKKTLYLAEQALKYEKETKNKDYYY